MMSTSKTLESSTQGYPTPFLGSELFHLFKSCNSVVRTSALGNPSQVALAFAPLLGYLLHTRKTLRQSSTEKDTGGGDLKGFGENMEEWDAKLILWI